MGQEKSRNTRAGFRVEVMEQLSHTQSARGTYSGAELSRAVALKPF